MSTETRKLGSKPPHIEVPEDIFQTACGIVMNAKSLKSVSRHTDVVDAIALASSSAALVMSVGVEAERSKQIEGFLTPAELEIVRERSRQVVGEGWTAEHDDEHVNEELALGACVYAMPLREANSKHASGFNVWQVLWPWDEKPRGLGDRRRCLVKAGALIVAEIERFDRAAIRKGGE